jgi:hypothetical protein
MNKLFVSMGLAAASVASVQLTQAADGTDGANGVDSKVWSVSATLRGFYDDNYDTSPVKHGSWGFEVSPEASVSVPLRQTDIGLRYVYGLYYYQQRDQVGDNSIDQSHDVDLWVDHAFSETWHGKVEDSLIVSQEPQLNQGSVGGTFVRTKQDNINNNGTATLTTDWTQEFSTEVGYQNSLYLYDDTTTNKTVGTLGTSLSGLLDRQENYGHINLDWIVSPHTTYFVGYRFGWVDYTGDQVIVPGSDIYSKTRDNRSHTGYVGADIDLLANLRFEGQAGIQYFDYYNSATTTASAESEVDPYADISLTYTYLPGSYLQLGFTEKQNATDVAAVTLNGKGQVTQGEQSSTVYGSINQQILPKLTGSLIGTYQYGTFSQGGDSGEVDNYYGFGVNVTYAFNRHFSAEAGYNYDDLTSDVSDRGYSRNRVYLGVTAAY